MDCSIVKSNVVAFGWKKQGYYLGNAHKARVLLPWQRTQSKGTTLETHKKQQKKKATVHIEHAQKRTDAHPQAVARQMHVRKADSRLVVKHNGVVARHRRHDA